MKKLRVLAVCTAFLLVIYTTGCKSREGFSSNNQDTGDEDATFIRWEDKGYSPKDLAVSYSETTVEVAEYHHAATIEVLEDGIYSRQFKTLGEFKTVAEVGDAYKTNMESIKEELEEYDLFPELSITTLVNAVQLGGMSEDRRQSYSVNYQMDGIVHVVYHVDFGNFTNDVISPKNIAENIQTYCGIKVSEDDLLILYYELLAHAQPEGSYSSYASDTSSYNYFSVSVKDFGTSAEHWEAYASVAVSPE